MMLSLSTAPPGRTEIEEIKGRIDTAARQDAAIW